MTSWASLVGAVVIVTGGGRGIGRTYAECLGGLGARVVVADVSAAAAEEGAAAVRAAGGEALAVVVDVADPVAVQGMVDATVAAYGRVDGLVNNAALMSTLPRRPFGEIPVEEWDAVMAVNLRGLFLCCRAAVPPMAARGRGKIVNISSSRVFEGVPNRLHYTTSKAGVVGFTRALAREVGPHGITVNAVAPGLTLSQTQLASSDAAYLEQMSEGRALARPQRPEDLLGAVCFLLAPASDYVTGQVLVVDGGRVMH